jgi:Bacteriophage lambda head decoration protein D
MPSNLSESYHALAFLEWEEDFNVSRKNIVVAHSASLPAGRVLGQITASGKYVSCDPTAEDGSAVAVAILAYDTDASAADVSAVAITKLAVANHNIINWDAAFSTDALKAAGIAQLAAVTIDVR